LGEARAAAEGAGAWGRLPRTVPPASVIHGHAPGWGRFCAEDT